MLVALDTLKIEFCHLATHSTGGIIAARMLLMRPQRFGRVLALDPVTPLGYRQMGLWFDDRNAHGPDQQAGDWGTRAPCARDSGIRTWCCGASGMTGLLR